MMCTETFNFALRKKSSKSAIVLKPLKAELNPICPSLALLGAHRILYVSRIRVNAQKI
jgi:hypothetical protein